MKKMIKKIKNSEADKQKLCGIKEIDQPRRRNSDFSEVVVNKPWGYEYLMYERNSTSVWILHIKKDNQTSMHCHKNKETALIVLEGEAICSTLNGNDKLSPGDALFLEKGVFHSTKAESNGGVIIMELESPNEKLDLVRIEDKYGRKMKGYESKEEISSDLNKYNVKFLKKDLEIQKYKNICFWIESFKENDVLKKEFAKGELMIILDGELIDEQKKSKFETLSYIDNNIWEKGVWRVVKPGQVLKIKKIKTKPKAVLFDFDGVLADTMEDNFLAWKKAFNNFGVDINPEDYFPLEGSDVAKISEKIGGKYNIDSKYYQKIKDQKNQNYLTISKEKEINFYPGVIETIDLLKRKGVFLAIVSASPKEKLKKTVPKEFLEKFDCLVTGESSKLGKPNPDPYLITCNWLNLCPEECIVIENSPLGIKSAKNANIPCIAISSTLNKEFLAEADLVIDKFEDLLKTEYFKELLD